MLYRHNRNATSRIVKRKYVIQCIHFRWIHFFYLLQILARDQSDIGVVERRLHEMVFFSLSLILKCHWKWNFSIRLRFLLSYKPSKVKKEKAQNDNMKNIKKNFEISCIRNIFSRLKIIHVCWKSHIYIFFLILKHIKYLQPPGKLKIKHNTRIQNSIILWDLGLE